jgi:hypothetical protein
MKMKPNPHLKHNHAVSRPSCRAGPACISVFIVLARLKAEQEDEAGIPPAGGMPAARACSPISGPPRKLSGSTHLESLAPTTDHGQRTIDDKFLRLFLNTHLTHNPLHHKHLPHSLRLFLRLFTQKTWGVPSASPFSIRSQFPLIPNEHVKLLSPRPSGPSPSPAPNPFGVRFRDIPVLQLSATQSGK